MKARRTKKRYADLFDHPKGLCPPSASGPGADVILYPNGQPEIWVKTDDGLGVALTIGHGPHGLSVTAQAFRRWYRGAETEADIALLGEDYRRKAPRAEGAR